MPAAVSLTDARNLALQNVQGIFLGANLLKTRLTTWKNGSFSELDLGTENQKTSNNWVVPTVLLICEAPTAKGDETVTLATAISEAVGRTLDSLLVAGLSAQQDTDILAAYNAAWT